MLRTTRQRPNRPVFAKFWGNSVISTTKKICATVRVRLQKKFRGERLSVVARDQKRREQNTPARARAPLVRGQPAAPDPLVSAVGDVVSAVERHARAAFSDPVAPGLYLVATPIGNLSDITLRALHVLARADAVYCEDTRHSRKLLDHFAIKATLKPYHEHNAAQKRPEILSALSGGERIALISDAGTPLISDPGYKIVREATEAGHNVVSIPGASAGLVGLTASGLPTDTVLFAGFLPSKEAGRRKRIASLSTVDATLVFFEAPHRIGEAVASLLAELGDRPACIARELTKLHEEIRRTSLAGLAQQLQKEDVKGECVIVVAPPTARAISDQEISDRLQDALAKMSLKDAARALAEELGVAKGRVYDLGLALKRRRADR